MTNSPMIRGFISASEVVGDCSSGAIGTSIVLNALLAESVSMIFGYIAAL